MPIQIGQIFIALVKQNNKLKIIEIAVSIVNKCKLAEQKFVFKVSSSVK